MPSLVEVITTPPNAIMGSVESSRVFVSGLPPSVSEAEFRKYFSTKGEVTDAKLIGHRRIGYVGYKTPEEAAKAVKYFNKSYIRMSKIGVELARPISDSTLPKSRKVQREDAREAQKAEKERREAKASKENLLKRKRDDADEKDEKLKEFMEVMQPASKSRTWTAAAANEDQEPPRKVQAMEMPEAESDEEYEAVPKKASKVSLVAAVPIKAQVSLPVDEPMLDLVEKVDLADQPDTTVESTNAPDATDDDWLRSRTSRLLDLVDVTDLPVVAPTQNIPTVAMSSSAIPALIPEPAVQVEGDFEGFSAHGEAEETTADVVDPTIEAIKASGRLFVRNLPYTATEDELRKHFEKYGAVEECHLPLDSAGVSKGFLLVQFENPSEAAEAFHNLDGEPFQGRLLHVLSATAKRENKLDEYAIAKLPLKKQRQIKKKAEASTTVFNWNSLYMNQDAVNSSIADRLGITKSQVLDPTSADAGVKQAIAETTIIQETKAYFKNNGVDLNAFRKKERGDTAILVKNFPFGMSLEELRKLFEEFGQVLRVLMPPSGTIAIVDFAQAPQARAAFASLAYRRMKDSVLFLEKAPKDLFTPGSIAEVTVAAESRKTLADPKISASDVLERDSQDIVDTTTLFVRNLSFATTSERLTTLFKPLDGFMSARVNTKTDPKKPGQVLSMGFGFLEFGSKPQAQAAQKAMDGYELEGHKLLIKASHKGLDAAEVRQKEDRAKKLAGKRTKIIIKNLPFEATKKDVRTLFGTYGQLRSVRVPKKFDNSARGFAFADFITAREAENALEALKDTHLLGRRLVIEFATEDIVDAEEEIEKMQKKVGKQVSKVALQKLTSGGRKKFNIQGAEEEDE